MMQKRLRLLSKADLEAGHALINKNLFKLLELEDNMGLEIVVSKKKFRFNLKIDDSLDDYVYLSKSEMERNGLSDKTIATIRGFKL
ncbi:MAG: hypothetical protein ACTSYQ_00245 [Candidatus Odinarchaeia archaeon]